MADRYFVYDASITAPLGRVPIWPYTLYYRMPHKCHGNAQNCPSRSHPVWEMVINELDRRDDPTFDEALPGGHQVTSGQSLIKGGVVSPVKLVNDHLPDGVGPGGALASVTVTLVRHPEVEGVWPLGHAGQGG